MRSKRDPDEFFRGFSAEDMRKYVENLNACFKFDNPNARRHFGKKGWAEMEKKVLGKTSKKSKR